MPMRAWSLAATVAVALAPASVAGASAAALVEINRATQAQLETVRGVGPDLSGAILAERDKAPFADWAELIRRVRGVGAASAARLSADGLTVNGQPYPGAAASRRTPAPRPAAP